MLRMGAEGTGQVCVVTLICSALKKACSSTRRLSLSLPVGRQWVLELAELGVQDQFYYFLVVSSITIFLVPLTSTPS